MPNAVNDSAGLVNFHKLVVLAETVEGARTLFEQFVNDVVGITHPEVRSITASPGDWGIDAFAGDLDGGNIGVWQAKFYLDKCDVGHQSDIRESFKAAAKSAVEHGYTLLTWTLVIPSEMTPPMTQWWDRWKKKTETDHKVAIELWDFGHLRRRMMAQEARETRRYWFSSQAIHAGQAPEPDEDPISWHDIANKGGDYDDFLFVHQLEHALMTETRSAREAFFNAEILEAEIADKAVPREIGALRTWRARIGSTWEMNFNHLASTSEGKQLPGLYNAVMTDIDHNHQEHAAALRAQTIHGQGLMHQQVESANAGWVRDWRDVAATHGAAGATDGGVAGNSSTPAPATSGGTHAPQAASVALATGQTRPQ